MKSNGTIVQDVSMFVCPACDKDVTATCYFDIDVSHMDQDANAEFTLAEKMQLNLKPKMRRIVIAHDCTAPISHPRA